MISAEHIEDPPNVRTSGSFVIAYLANSFPSSVEPYVGEEIDELRKRGIRIIPCSVWRTPAIPGQDPAESSPVLTLATLQPWIMLRAVCLCVVRFPDLRDFFHRIFRGGSERWPARARALAHTCLGVALALQLKDRNVGQIAVHHGYMAAWIGMVAARLLKIPYSLTLHGSDLLVRPTFLDTKLRHCALCLTVSEFNRQHVIKHYPKINPEQVIVRRMGVRVLPRQYANAPTDNRVLNLLAVGRLHPVKDHAFLIRACAALKSSGIELSCRIAGAGPEGRRLARLIRNLHLEREVELLGHVDRRQLDLLYCQADLVVLTSTSEGIPLTLMEAMAVGRPVLAPAITGLPELVLDGKTGFLYEPGSITSFVERVEFVRRSRSALGPVCQAAQDYVNSHFNLTTNLQQLGDTLVKRILRPEGSIHANSLLQQVQL